MTFQPGTLVRNTDETLKELNGRNYVFRVKDTDRFGIARLEIVGNEQYGDFYLYAKDLAAVEPDVQEVS